MNVAIFGNEYQVRKSASIHQVLSALSRHEVGISIERSYYDFLTDCQCIDLEGIGVFYGNAFDADFAISMGGDGTFLKTAARVGDKGTPILGINMGRLGYLADISPGEIDEAVSALLKGDYQIERHTVIGVKTVGEQIADCPYALNDIAILKRDTASMIAIHTSLDGKHLMTYQADGLIVSTPTGSTAYSLSNGGPIIIPQAGVLCLTPVAPHSLGVRPIVIKDDSVLEMTVESRSHNFLVAVDGRSEKMPEETRMTIRKAPYSINIVKRKGYDFFNTLREKMMWGADRRCSSM